MNKQEYDDWRRAMSDECGRIADQTENQMWAAFRIGENVTEAFDSLVWGAIVNETMRRWMERRSYVV